MKKLLSILILPLILFGYKIEITEWGKGNTFFGFLKKYHIPYSLYYNLDKKTQKKISYISSKATIYILEDGNNLKQALIPLDENSQLQIVRKGKKLSGQKKQFTKKKGAKTTVTMKAPTVSTMKAGATTTNLAIFHFFINIPIYDQIALNTAKFGRI